MPKIIVMKDNKINTIAMKKRKKKKRSNFILRKKVKRVFKYEKRLKEIIICEVKYEDKWPNTNPKCFHPSQKILLNQLFNN